MVQEIIAMEKVLQAGIVSECVFFNSLEIDVEKTNSKKILVVSACPELRNRLGCFRDKCIVHTSSDFKCFKVRVPIPHRELSEQERAAA